MSATLQAGRPIHLSAWQSLRHEVAINGARILRKTVNDFSLWRLIEYPQAAAWLDVAPGELVLDIGVGRSSFPLMMAREGARVVALDISEERVQWQKNKAGQVLGAGTNKILPVVASATALPFCDGAFSRVTSISALEHVPDDKSAAAEIGRVLRDGGLAVISLCYTFRERKQLFNGVKRFQEVEKNRWVQADKNGYQIRFYTDDDLNTRFATPARARIEKVGYFGRKIIDGWYHQTWLNRFWFSFIFKDFLLALTLYPFEERFLRGTEPFNVIFRMRKAQDGKQADGVRR